MRTSSRFPKIASALLAVFALWQAGAPAHARTARDAAVEDSRVMCERYGGGTLRLEPGFETRLELNGDGQPDTLLDMTKMHCDGAATFQPMGCGEHGCSLIAYVSTRRVNWMMAFSGNEVAGPVYRWDMIPATGGRSAVRLTMGGAACNPIKAKACTQTLTWDASSIVAKRSSLAASSVPQVTSPTRVAATSEQAPVRLGGGGANNRSAAWNASRTAEGFTVAYVEIGGSVQRILLHCNGVRAQIHVVLRLSPSEGPLALNITNGGNSATVSLQKDAQSGHWTSLVVSPSVLSLLAQPATDTYMTMNGEDLGFLPLTGSTAALHQSLSPCHSFANRSNSTRIAPSAAAAAGGFSINVTLTPRAARRLAALNERILVQAYYSATAKSNAPERVLDEVTGELMLGQEEVTIGPQGGLATFTTRPLRRDLLRHAETPPVVLVNVFTARQVAKDNLLNCGIVSEAVSSLSGQRTVSCDLI